MKEFDSRWASISIVGMLLIPSLGFAADLPAIFPPARPESPVRPAIEAFHDGFAAAGIRFARSLAEKGDPDALFLLAMATEPPLPYTASPKQSQYQAVAYYYRQAAEAGHPEALLRSYLYAVVADKNLNERAKAKASLESAAEGGDVRAIRVSGEGYLRGIFGGKPDAKEAQKWWTRSAEKGDAASLFLLAKLHRGDFGFPDEKNTTESVELFRKAADLDYEDAFIPLGSTLLQSGTTEKEGREWLKKAISRNLWRACFVLGEFEKNKKGDQEAAKEYFKHGAEAGQSDCMFEIGDQLIKENQEVEGLKWIRKSADAGNATASFFLGKRFLDDPSSDVQLAYRHLLDAAEDGMWQAQYRLALLYLDGRLGRSDPATAVAWLTRAMTEGDSEVRFKLGTLNELGIGTPVNYANAGVLYEMTFKKGHAGAGARMAHLLAEGLGTERNPPLAWAYAAIAVERGEISAKMLLDRLEANFDETEKVKAKQELERVKTEMKKPANEK